MFDSIPFINELFAKEDDNSIYDYPTFFDFCMQQFEEKYNFNIDTFNVSDPDTYPSWCNGTLPDCTGWSPFLYILQDDNFNPTYPLPPLAKLRPLGIVSVSFFKFVTDVQMWWWNRTAPDLFRGLIKYDFNDDTYNMQLIENLPLPRMPNQPILFITGNDGHSIIDSIQDGQPSSKKVDFWVNEKYNVSVISSDVVGQINGTDPSKTIICSCLYDCWWNQGAGDSAIGMGTLLAIAKFMKDHHIKPKYNVKFIAFAGEEQQGTPGAQYYDDTTTDDIITIIDLNQFGFSQTGSRPQTFYVDTNRILLIPTLSYIINDTNYCGRSGTPFLHYQWSPQGGPSDSSVLIKGHPARESILFVKDMNWTLHHRDGENHGKGDTMDYYDPADVSATADMIWNVTKYFTVNPNCSFDGQSHIHQRIRQTTRITTWTPSKRTCR